MSTDNAPQPYEPVPAAAAVPLQVVVKQDGSRRARDGAQYVRRQNGHSLTLHLLFGAFVLWIPTIYYTLSPRHYWHV